MLIFCRAALQVAATRSCEFCGAFVLYTVAVTEQAARPDYPQLRLSTDDPLAVMPFQSLRPGPKPGRRLLDLVGLLALFSLVSPPPSNHFLIKRSIGPSSNCGKSTQ